jgi:two-component system, cell cycle sensor histidine kinase PleC
MKSPLVKRISMLVIGVFLLAVVLSAFAFQRDYGLAISGAREAARHQSLIFAEHAGRAFEAVDLILRRVTYSIETKDLRRVKAAATLQSELKELVEFAPQLRAIVTVDADGTQTASNSGRGVGVVNISDRAYFQSHKADPNIGLLIDRPLRGKITGTWFLSVSRRVNNPDGSFGGVVIAVVSQEYFNKLYQQTELNEGLSTLMIAGNKVFAFSKGNVTDQGDLSGASIDNSEQLKDHIGTGTQGVFEGQVFEDGIDRLVAVAPLHEHSVNIVTSITRDQALSDFFRYLLLVSTVLLLSGAILIVLLMLTLRQITQRHQIETELLAAEMEAEKGNKAKSDFLASMSHELRTPLNAIIGYSDMLKRHTFGTLGSDKNIEYVSDINSAGTHLLGLINDILDISKIDAGKEDILVREVDIDPVLRECVEMVKVLANERHISISHEMPNFFPTVKVDSRHLSQILINLLSNAIKFTPHGGSIDISVMIGIDRSVEIKITDTGIGISADEIPKVMEEFERAGEVLSRSQQGTGLGLPLTKRLVELNNGTLSIQSEVGKGTTVTVHFPG